ncbi:hypothetical protein LI82_08470 [Methanococcoides methylutens]|uniref:DUF7847 domain-containing protein n=1 Tax=Methanococcoides methylutens TaxID=2226 RepID=A0A099SY17_METMT|nr:hypothetical protein [Methanococcoides methylutens]KGK97797.1 hypothetical protein LI82_08470 [Methanococcoides methylutens]
MHEDLGKVLNKGFGTWKRNLGIAIPFIFNMLLSMLVLVMAVIILTFLVIAPSVSEIADPSALSPEEAMEMIMPLFSESIGVIIIFGLLTMLVLAFIQSYFTAGAVGMAKMASESGHTTLSDMFRYGNDNVISLLMAKIMVFLISLAGVIFIVPGALVTNDFGTLMSNPENAVVTSMMLLFGFLLWVIYAIIVGLILSPLEFCLVVDNLDPMSALKKAYSFFMENKMDVFLLFLVMISISVLNNLLSEVMSTIEALGAVWAFISFILSFAVIQPLITVWWTRLYMSRSEKELYDISELLEYP